MAAVQECAIRDTIEFYKKLIKTTITTQNQGYAIYIVVDIGKYIPKIIRNKWL